MIKRRYFLALAAGFLASAAFATSAQAAGTKVTTSVNFGSLANTTNLTEIDFTYTGAGTITGLSGFTGLALKNTGGGSYAGVTASTMYVAPNTIELLLPGGATAVSGNFTFFSSTPYATAPGTLTVKVTTKPSGHQGMVTTVLSFAPAVPEPSSMALLGIGMTSFLAFRRIFKRTPLV